MTGSPAGARFRVWAPLAARVDLVLGEARHPMAAERCGWWSVEAPGAGAGTDYAFALDGDAPLPDPRSPWQPHGVHGPSRLVDQSAFPWTDASWQAPPLASAVFYELHVSTFTRAGTFEAVIERLDDLRSLGVTHVELMPVAEFPGTRGWGYDGVDLWAPHHAYGGPEGLKRLVDACHARGLAVILDVVYNHLGPDGNYLGRFGPYFTDRYRTPWGEAVNFDGPGSDEVRRFVCDNALMWFRDYHFDGLRIDAVHSIADGSAVHVLEQLAEEVEAFEAEVGRHLLLIAESDLNDPRLIRSREAGGYGLHAQWADDLHHALHTILTGEQDGYYADFGTLADVAKVLTEAFVYDGRHSAFRRRRHGRPATGLSGHRFVVCLQNHDQVGNRAQGERINHLVSVELLKVGTGLLLTAPFVPLLFQGQEWAASAPFQYFTDHQDPELGRAVSDGRRREFAAFGWHAEDIPDPQAPSTFARSKLDWNERDREPHRSVLDWHRELLRLRRELPWLTDGRRERSRVRFDEAARWLVIDRGPVTVAANLGDRSVRVAAGDGTGRVRLASDARVALAEGGVDLPPASLAVLVRDAGG
jgi:maltooligosyltrehalose trehalohydrolase